MTEWFAIHLRNGKSHLVEGEAARDRALARKTPAAVGWSVPVIHTCSVCGIEGPWQSQAWVSELQSGDGWCFVSERHDSDRDWEKVDKFCSTGCRKLTFPDEQLWGRNKRKFRAIAHYEPLPDEQRWNSWTRQREGGQEMRAHRRFEMPVHPNSGVGWCRWCGLEIIDRKGKNRGKRSRLRTWHHLHQGDDRDCYREYLLHTDRIAQYWFLIERDGPGCADCGVGEGRWMPSADHGSVIYIRWSVKLEVDHETALWLIAYLPLDKPAWRRALFSPDNLKLRCLPCHQRKSAREAADRTRRRDEEQLRCALT
jgi:hypothetical protein